MVAGAAALGSASNQRFFTLDAGAPAHIDNALVFSQVTRQSEPTSTVVVHTVHYVPHITYVTSDKLVPAIPKQVGAACLPAGVQGTPWLIAGPWAISV